MRVDLTYLEVRSKEAATVAIDRIRADGTDIDGPYLTVNPLSGSWEITYRTGDGHSVSIDGPPFQPGGREYFRKIVREAYEEREFWEGAADALELHHFYQEN